MKTKTVFMMLTVITPLIVVAITQITVTSASAQTENMTMEELTNASLAQYPDTMENDTTMEEETSALVGNMTGNMTSQNMTIVNMTG